MDSFQPSRGRVLFEVVLALGMAASFAGAWIQMGASALLGAAGVAALYGLVHLFDMRRPKPMQAAEPQLELDSELETSLPAEQTQAVPSSADDQPSAAGTSDPVAGTTTDRKPKARRKAGARRPKTAKVAKLAPVPAEEPDGPWPLAAEDEQPNQSTVPAEEEFAFEPEAEEAHPHIAPLFEPEPFARMQRRAFGRRGRI